MPHGAARAQREHVQIALRLSWLLLLRTVSHLRRRQAVPHDAARAQREPVEGGRPRVWDDARRALAGLHLVHHRDQQRLAGVRAPVCAGGGVGVGLCFSV